MQLITPSSGGQPSVKRLGLEMAEITIEENDDARGIFNFNVIKVNKSERKTCKVAFRQDSLISQMTYESVLISFIILNCSGENGQILDKQIFIKRVVTNNSQKLLWSWQC